MMAKKVILLSLLIRVVASCSSVQMTPEEQSVSILRASNPKNTLVLNEACNVVTVKSQLGYDEAIIRSHAVELGANVVQVFHGSYSTATATAPGGVVYTSHGSNGSVHRYWHCNSPLSEIAREYQEKYQDEE